MPKQPKTPDLDARVAALHARRDELTAEIAAARTALAAAQSDAIDGKAGASDAVTQAQARLSGAEGTASMLAERITTAEANVEAAERSVEADALRADMARAARAAQAAVDAEAEATARLVEVFAPAVAEIYAARRAARSAQTTFAGRVHAAESLGLTRAEAVEPLDVDTRIATADSLPSPDLGQHPHALGRALALAITELAERETAAEQQALAEAHRQSRAAQV